MKPPHLPIKHPDRIGELKATLAPALVALMDAANKAGWTSWEIDAAFRSVVADWVRRNAKFEAPAVEIEPALAALLGRMAKRSGS
jgi:hypothetical protein